MVVVFRVALAGARRRRQAVAAWAWAAGWVLAAHPTLAAAAAPTALTLLQEDERGPPSLLNDGQEAPGSYAADHRVGSKPWARWPGCQVGGLHAWAPLWRGAALGTATPTTAIYFLQHTPFSYRVETHYFIFLHRGVFGFVWRGRGSGGREVPAGVLAKGRARSEAVGLAPCAS